MKALVIAGGLPQIELIKQLKERGIETLLADGSASAVARSFADKFFHVDVFDIEAIKSIAVNEKVDFLITVCADQVLLVVAEVSEALGLPWYIDYETAKKQAYQEAVLTFWSIITSNSLQRYVNFSNLVFLYVTNVYSYLSFALLSPVL